MANVEISILGQQYKIGCPDGEEQSLYDSVEIFNDKLKEIRSQRRTLRNEQLIVLAALNFSHELDAEKTKHAKQTELLNERIKTLQESIELALQPIKKES